MSLDLYSQSNKIINLTEFGRSDVIEESDDLIIIMCPHCEKAMILAYEDIVSYPSNQVIVKKNQFYCSRCGLIQDSNADLISKKREQQGPKISKRKSGDSLGFFFEVIRFNNQKRDKPKEFDIDEKDDERLRAEGCTIKETRVTSAETGRTIVRRYDY